MIVETFSKESSLERSSTGSTQPFVGSGKRGPDLEGVIDLEEGNLSVNNENAASLSMHLSVPLSSDSLPRASMGGGEKEHLAIDQRPSLMNILSEIYALEKELFRRGEIPSIINNNDVPENVEMNQNDADDNMQISLEDLFKDLPDIRNANFADELLKDVSESNLPLLDQLDLDEILGSCS